MATLTTSWANIATKNLSWTYSGTTHTATVALQGKYDSQSGNSATVRIRLGIKMNTSVTWTGTNKHYQINGGSWSQDTSNLTTSWRYMGETSLGTKTGGSTTTASVGYGVARTSSWGSTVTVSGDLTLPTFTTPPTGLAVEVRSKTHESATIGVSIAGYGNPASASGRYIEAAILGQNSYGTSYRYTHSSEGAMSEDITVNNSSSGTSSLKLVGNTKYWYGGYATNTLSSTNKVGGEIYLPCPPLEKIEKVGEQKYATYNTISQTISYARQDDGGAEARTGEYRYSSNNGQTWSAWTSWGLVENMSGSFVAIVPTSSTVLVQARLTTPNGGAGEAIETSFTTLATHTIEFSNFEYKDINPDVVAITGNNKVFIQRQSTAQITIPLVDKAQIIDDSGATLNSYRASLGAETIEIPYSSIADTSGVLSKSAVTSSAVKEIVVSARDSLGALKTIQKNVSVIPWTEPTLIATYTRINQKGNILLDISGDFAPLVIDGASKNVLQASYRVDSGEEVPFELEIVNGKFSARVPVDTVDFGSIYYVYVKIADIFADTEVELEVSNIEQGRRLTPVEYNIEVWDWKTNTFQMDISHIVLGDLAVKWTLNDIEELSFRLNLATFEKQCSILGVDPRDMLVPYVHDIRVRRNGEYIVGCQIVEANVSFSGTKDPQLQIRATGYLNLFKDRYIDIPWSGYSYSQIAKMLIEYGQRADCLIKNPTIDIDTSYWLPIVGAIARVNTSPTPHSGAGCLKVSNSNSGGHLTIGSQMNVPAGTPIKIDFWFQNSASITVYERQYATQITGQKTIGVYSEVVGANWTHWTLDTYTTAFENGYIVVDSTNGGKSENYMAVDDFNVFRIDDEDSLHDFNVVLGVDTATENQDKTRERNYELQNIKDAIMDLVALEDDNFDFEFTHNRVFNIYGQKGSEKRELSLEYPGNISGLEITQSAAELANKIQNIGSGIGDERIEVWATDRLSREKYGTRESIVTNNNVSLTETLTAQAEGLLNNQKDIARTLSITVEDGSINPSNLQTGDVIPFKVGPRLQTHGYTIIKELEGWYRVKAIQLSVSQDAVENMNLTLELYERFDGGES